MAGRDSANGQWDWNIYSPISFDTCIGVSACGGFIGATMAVSARSSDDRE